jgi:ATP-dependent exoDNAse (exonuclease V) beta subunit
MQLQIRTASHPLGKLVEFHPEPHHYLMEGHALTSVTKLIHRWFPEFDAENIAKRKAEREGGDFEALLSEWARKRDEAAAFGSKVHLMAETILQQKKDDAADHLPVSEREQAYLAGVKEALKRISLGYDVVETEMIVFSPERMVAGTVDLLLRSRATGEYVVADWKTNKEIKFKAFGQESGSGPCAKLAHCNFNHYSLQTSAYGELLTSERYLPEGARVRGVLLHLKELPGGKVFCDYVKTKDLKFEASACLAAGNPYAVQLHPG